MWILQNYSITHILREIKVGVYKVSKTAIFINNEALNLDFYEILHILKAEISQINQILTP